MPERTHDPIVATAAIVMALQTIVSRNLPASELGVISIGSIQAGATHNVIPQEATLLLNVRSTNPAIRERIEQRIREIVTLQARSFGVDAHIEYKKLVPMVFNAEQPMVLARHVLERLVGADNVRTDLGGLLGSEDFAWMAQALPGCYVIIGNGSGEAGGCMLHNSHYDFNDDIIGLGARYFIELVREYLT
jgi:hippurate hydrolase